MARILKQHAERRLADVPDQYVFWCQDGRMIKSIRELKEAFGMMSDDTYLYHANRERNDYSNWVKDIIGDEKLARDLFKASDKHQASKYVKARERFLLGKI
jgi:hypothetical protein